MKNNLVDTVQTLHLRETELSHNVEKAEELRDKTDELLINARKAKNKPKKKGYRLFSFIRSIDPPLVITSSKIITFLFLKKSASYATTGFPVPPRCFGVPS